MLNTADEYELRCRLVQDDCTAFDALYRHYFSAVYSNALKLTRDPAVAQDVLQDVFIALWENRKTIDVNRPVGGWLFATCYNKAVNQLRKKLQQSLTHRQLQPPDAETNTDTALYEQQWQVLEKTIAQLPPQKRKVFELCKLQGKSYEETATILQISKYTVKEYLSGAVCFVKAQVKQHRKTSAASAISLLLYIVS